MLYSNSAPMETPTETHGSHMAENNTIKAAIIAKVPSCFEFDAFIIKNKSNCLIYFSLFVDCN
jgi:hypothetical protein